MDTDRRPRCEASGREHKRLPQTEGLPPAEGATTNQEQVLHPVILLRPFPSTVGDHSVTRHLQCRVIQLLRPIDHRSKYDNATCRRLASETRRCCHHQCRVGGVPNHDWFIVKSPPVGSASHMQTSGRYLAILFASNSTSAWRPVRPPFRLLSAASVHSETSEVNSIAPGRRCLVPTQTETQPHGKTPSRNDTRPTRSQSRADGRQQGSAGPCRASNHRTQASAVSKR
ncbi:hypothetical protein B0J13DRAFT_173053 [Dactylonectria estremocensis]|uniref:Uncharacterized protein n=1 Tax=Dactylonectria estremocensis TaxID=1079267 RepID=A0A9P9JEJ3_9HYPO|nr:hypothetical protein B0J13DRAFT_173053 [Dactylonectria estremocensis]